MRHTLSILLQNESGALLRVAGMFAARHCNIDTLTVAATHDPAISQLTLVLHGDEATLEQIVRQTRKLIDVLDVSTLSLSGSESGRLVAMTAPP
ncbi:MULTISPECIES: acetolactate synthase small subunit [unclassified Rhodanobacter]|jgi:acetolactate synthase I/III small subunit|uniref:acetolactate synthase small subunit n=1 Tax=unclassified Rhodanobacter TaxID=2621553 RepID=UPI001609FD6C|nr:MULTISPECIES: acetolactate synthase small subunit [unclassified Rhodanobacter]MBB6243568.1 acetolactate synthase-1/3 small subunit [Rhodanobacter sp. MP1X3]MBB6248185.1 acetolactate synthase-1/3 small subunit [Rhodanobacter sp. A1T4]